MYITRQHSCETNQSWVCMMNAADQSPRKTSAIGAFFEVIHHIRQNCFRDYFICEVLLDNVLFIKTTKILTFYAHISTNTRLFIVWIEELFCWRMSTSIYIVSDQKLTTGAHGFGVADNVTANALVKKTRHSACFKMTGLFQYFTNFRMSCFAFSQTSGRVTTWQTLSQKCFKCFYWRPS